MQARLHYRLIWPVSLGVALLLAILSAPSVFAQQIPSRDSDYIGSKACGDCHAAIYASFQKTPHWKTTLDTRRGARWQGCESCHGPGREHRESSGDPTKIFSFKNAAAREIVARCLECHQYGEEHSNFLRSAHKSGNVSCLDCHSPHHFTQEQFLLRKPQPQLCYGCHLEVQADFEKPFHHRVNEKLVRCTDCHNQHGGFVSPQLRATAQQDSACLKCHVEKSGPFVFEHAPLRTEGCTSCHFPHGSENPRMLKVSQVNLLCLDCHTVTFGRGAMVRDTPGFHDQAAEFQACTLCHVSIHGSNFNRMFFR